MLLKNFYQIEKYTVQEDLLEAIITFNPEHEIYKGHFPGNPVVPGVALTQIVKELVEKYANHSLFLENASNIKFMSMVNPEVTSQLNIKFKINTEEDVFKADGTAANDEVIFFKFKGTFRSK